jgi:hypothetical protein
MLRPSKLKLIIGPRSKRLPCIRSAAQQRQAPRAPAQRYHRGVEPPAITRYRRPFLAPLWVIPAALVLLAALGWLIYRGATTTVVFLVQPLERADGAVDATVAAGGGEHDRLLLRMFGGGEGAGKLAAVYAESGPQTQRTGALLGEQLHLRPRVFASADAGAAAAGAVREYAGETVLMIAGADASGQILQRLASGIAAAPDPACVYVISVPRIGRAHLAKFRY